MTLEQFEEVCAAYCIGNLSQDERIGFEKYLESAGVEELAILDKFMMVSRHLPVASDLVAPAPRVREAILAQINSVAPSSGISFQTTAPISSTAKWNSLLDGIRNFKIDSGIMEVAYRALKLDRPMVALGLPVVLFLILSFVFLEQMSLRGDLDALKQSIAQNSDVLNQKTQELNEVNQKLAEQESKIQAEILKASELEKKSAEFTEQMAAKQKELDDLKATAGQTQEFVALMQSNDLRVTDLKGLKPYLQSRAKIMYSPKTKVAFIQIANMAPPPAGKDYQLWMMEGAKPVSAGVLAVASSDATLIKVPVALSVPIQRLSAFAITVEPKGGVVKPTGQAIMKGLVKL